jgi:hypothetical protein
VYVPAVESKLELPSLNSVYRRRPVWREAQGHRPLGGLPRGKIIL